MFEEIVSLGSGHTLLGSLIWEFHIWKGKPFPLQHFYLGKYEF